MIHDTLVPALRQGCSPRCENAKAQSFVKRASAGIAVCNIQRGTGVAILARPVQKVAQDRTPDPRAAAIRVHREMPDIGHAGHRRLHDPFEAQAPPDHRQRTQPEETADAPQRVQREGGVKPGIPHGHHPNGLALTLGEQVVAEAELAAAPAKHGVQKLHRLPTMTLRKHPPKSDGPGVVDEGHHSIRVIGETGAQFQFLVHACDRCASLPASCSQLRPSKASISTASKHPSSTQRTLMLMPSGFERGT